MFIWLSLLTLLCCGLQRLISIYYKHMTVRPISNSIIINRRFAARLISLLVGLHGLFLLATVLLGQFEVHHGSRLLSSIVIDVPLLIGVSLMYLGSLLRRRKQTAWYVSIVAYLLYLTVGIAASHRLFANHHMGVLFIVRGIILPSVILVLLFLFRHEFVVQSDPRGFRAAAQFSFLVIAAALIYGIVGFTLLDKPDFHQEITFTESVHYTIDQFDLTTKHPLQPHSRRARVFVDSLSFVSTSAVIYAVIALFQPLRLLRNDQTANRERLQRLLDTYGAPSEDYFKLWPHDKQYYFHNQHDGALAYHVWRGVALCLGDPVGDPKHLGDVVDAFGEECYQNDWLPTYVHVQDTHRKMYKSRGYTLQKLGQEAVVDLAHFESEVAATKYFRQINNKFTKQGYTAELIRPPHHQAVLNRLREISDDWLARGGRVERGFAMGYYSDEYMQLCPIMVARDAAGTIQAFMNQLPATFDSEEATYDLLRNTQGSLGNSTDYLILKFITELQQMGYKRLNLGLCPLTGLNESSDPQSGLIHNLLRFAYANGDRFYSFSGLYKFKAKYEPEWRDRYVAYQGGVRGFGRSMTALMRTMRIKTK